MNGLALVETTVGVMGGKGEGVCPGGGVVVMYDRFSGV